MVAHMGFVWRAGRHRALVLRKLDILDAATGLMICVPRRATGESRWRRRWHGWGLIRERYWRRISGAARMVGACPGKRPGCSGQTSDGNHARRAPYQGRYSDRASPLFRDRSALLDEFACSPKRRRPTATGRSCAAARRP